MNKYLLTLAVLATGAMVLPAQPVITLQPTNQIVLNGSNVVFSVAVSGAGPFTYQWQCNGTNLPNNIITTVAGNGNGSFTGSGTFSGDDGAATNAGLYDPSGVAVDAAGNLFISDTYNNRIRKLDTNGIITTVAGNGGVGYSGDGGNATNASLNLPGSWNINAVSGICVDNQGNLYIADPGNNRIRELNNTGIITTIVGNGNNAYSGDGGQAINASLSEPRGVAIDIAGNLYVADTGNNCIRKIATNGIITTIAGGGSQIIMWANSGYLTLPATNAQLNIPLGIAVDTNGNLFIADTWNKRIESVDTNGVLTVIAGYGMLEGFSGDGGAATNATFTRAKGVSVNPAQNLYIMDSFNNRIRNVDSNGIIMTVVGNGAGYPNGAFGGDGGAATNASLQCPTAAAFTPSGNMYLADSWNNRIRFVSFAGLPYLSLNSVSLTNNGNYCVVVTDSSGSVTSSIVSLTVLVPAIINAQPISQVLAVGNDLTLSVGAYGTSPINYQWFFNGLAMNSQTNSQMDLGNATTNQRGSYTVVVTNLYGSATSSIAAVDVGYPPAITTQPTNLTAPIGSDTLLSAGVTGSGLLSYQWQLNGTNLPNKIITTVAGKSSSGFSGDYGAATNATLNVPVGITSDKADNIFIADSYNHRIRKIDTNGIITTFAGKSSAGYTGDGVAATNAALYYPAGITLDASNSMYIADTYNSRVRKVDANGFITTIAGTNTAGSTGDGGFATTSKLNMDRTVAFDAVGNLYIADTVNSRIRKVNTNGVITTVAGNGTASFSGDGGNATSASLNYPYSVTIDCSGNLFIADTRNNRIRRVSTNGIITTAAGKGPSYPSSRIYSGDGGTATNAYINSPRGVAIDPAGNLFIADTGNSRIRKVDVNGIISTVVGKSSSGFSGDGGASTNASLYNPEGIAFDTAGNLLIADTMNARIRKVFLYAGNNILSLHNLNSKNGGDYRLIATSAFGSVTSAVANLTILVPPQHFTGQFASGGLQLQFTGTPNYPYILQSATNLTPPINWQPVLTNPADGNGNWQFMDTNMNWNQKFYRAAGQ